MKNIDRAVEKYRDLILEAEKYIWDNPETGYKEYKTSAYMEEKFRELGYELTLADGITGFYTVIDTGREGPEVMVLAELDSVICPSHPAADKTTGAVHACGHNAQCAAMLGIAAALKDESVISKLSGRIRLSVVPAEELLEIGYRSELREKGIIKYFGGKCEFLHRGYFDGVDIAFMVHTAGGLSVEVGSNGCIAKNIIYKGVAAHAGGAPHHGINALYAANCGINAINAIRETFRDSDHVRVHPIITHGGDIVNAIPERVTIESYVRGKSFEALEKNNKKVNRALGGAALSVGANVEIIDIPGYSPLNNDRGMMEIARDASVGVFEQEFYMGSGFGTGSTDMGDLSCIMPVVHPYAGGYIGTGHGSDFYITDPKEACVDSARWQLAMLKLLLEDNAKMAKNIIAEFKPLFASKEDYLNYVDKICCSGDRIEYSEEGASVKL
jgi:amidohydrolase